jgi:predicted nucleic acid-binding protein
MTVSDTTPLNYLVLVDAVAVLPALFGHVIIPGAVREELLRMKAPEKVRRWASDPPTWIEVHPVTKVDETLGFGTADKDRGEREAISLALDLRPDFVLLDDRLAREAASARELRVIGTLGILEAAAARGLLDPAAITRLERDTNFRASAPTFQASRERAESAWKRRKML